MQYLVDSNVLSEGTKQHPIPSVLEWLREHESELAVNPIIVGELEYGILGLPAGRRRTRLLSWFSGVVRHLQLVELDADAAHIWATLLATLKRKGRAMPLKDSLIAASALQHGLAIATRNTDHYLYSGVKIVNPFGA